MLLRFPRSVTRELPEYAHNAALSVRRHRPAAYRWHRAEWGIWVVVRGGMAAGPGFTAGIYSGGDMW